MLAEIGMSSFSLDDGSTVEVKQTYGASILVDKRPEAYDWLRDHGHDDIIKNTVLCQFGRGEDDQAGAFAAFAQKQGFIPEQKTRGASSNVTCVCQRTLRSRRGFSDGVVRSMGRSTRSN